MVLYTPRVVVCVSGCMHECAGGGCVPHCIVHTFGIVNIVRNALLLFFFFWHPLIKAQTPTRTLPSPARCLISISVLL